MKLSFFRDPDICKHDDAHRISPKLFIFINILICKKLESVKDKTCPRKFVFEKSSVEEA